MEYRRETTVANSCYYWYSACIGRFVLQDIDNVNDNENDSTLA